MKAKVKLGALTSQYHNSLLDLTAAFDTVDHDLMMLKLERQFGFRSVVLDWFRLYLCGRTYRVIHGGKTSYLFTLYVPCLKVLVFHFWKTVAIKDHTYLPIHVYTQRS